MTTLLVAGLAISVATNIGMATVLFTRRTYPGFGYWLLGTLLAWSNFLVPSVNARIVLFGIYSSVVQLWALWALWALRVLLTHRPVDFGSGDRLQAVTIASVTLGGNRFISSLRCRTSRSAGTRKPSCSEALWTCNATMPRWLRSTG